MGKTFKSDYDEDYDPYEVAARPSFRLSQTSRSDGRMERIRARREKEEQKLSSLTVARE